LQPRRVENVVGIFDSGVGGLTVLRAVMRFLPGEDIVYFGDAARIPYGTKSHDTVKRFALEDARFLLRFKPKIIVVACNTASAVAVDHVAERIDCPVHGVVRPGAKAAGAATKTGRVGVMATETTVASGAYQREISADRPDASVFVAACPLLVPIIEDGRDRTDAIARLAVEEYVSHLVRRRVDTILLGCTHYPLLADLIGELAGEGVRVVDSATETAKAVAFDMRRRSLLNNTKKKGKVYFLTTDHPRRFAEVGSRFLGYPIKKVFLVEPEEFFSVT